MLNIRPKRFENEFPAHFTFIFNQGCGIEQILMMREYVYFLDKDNTSELLKAFHYHKNSLIIRSVVTLWIAQYY